MIWLRLVLLAAIGYGLWKFLQPNWAFVIVVDESGVRSHHGIRTPQQNKLLDLFSRTRFVEGRVKICGRYDSAGRLQLRFQGRLSQDARQQIRNFVTNEL